MKFQGKILNWNDDKGYGFVEPDGGGERAFVHIKAFKSRSRRPVNGEIISYELVRENDHRYKAENVKFAYDSKNFNKRNKITSGSTFGNIFIMVFGSVLLVSVFMGKLPLVIIGLYVVMSFITFVVYALDKSAAQNDRWRTKESTLHMFSLIGGWPGAFFAQNNLHHKSNKKKFKGVYWATVLLNLGGLFWLYTEKGINFLNNVVLPLLKG